MDVTFAKRYGLTVGYISWRSFVNHLSANFQGMSEGFYALIWNTMPNGPPDLAELCHDIPADMEMTTPADGAAANTAAPPSSLASDTHHDTPQPLTLAESRSLDRSPRDGGHHETTCLLYTSPSPRDS